MRSFFQRRTAQDHVHPPVAHSSRYSFPKTFRRQVSLSKCFQSRKVRQDLIVSMEEIVKLMGKSIEEGSGRYQLTPDGARPGPSRAVTFFDGV